MADKDKTISPKALVDTYRRAYQRVYGVPPQIRYMGGYWYQINGQVRPRSHVVQELLQLRRLAKEEPRRRAQPVSRGLVQRLIARLKTI